MNKLFSSERKIYTNIHRWIVRYGLGNIILFVFLVIFFQFSWKVMELILNWNTVLKPLYDLSIKLNVHATSWALSGIFNIYAHPEGDIIRLQGVSLQIIQTCEGLKQLFLFFFVILIFPGQHIHKLWFIPLGLIEIIIVNLLRFIGLCLTLIYNPRLFDIMHNYIFYIIYYGNIFLLWIIWESRFKKIKGAISKMK